MEKLDARKRGAFMWALLLSVGFPVGIIMIIFGFKNGGGFIAMAIVGIVLTVAGFYGSPLVWVYFGILCKYKNYAMQIVNNKIRSVKMLAEMHNTSQKIMANDVKTMVQKNYLPGFVVLDDEHIVDKTAMKRGDYEVLEAERAGELNLVHCPFCNAKFEMILDVGECPYCKSKITKEMLQSTVKAYNKDDKQLENNK